MKKLIIGTIFLLTSSFVFADVFSSAEQIADNFLNKGTVIKVIEDKNNIKYITRTSVVGIAIDEDDLEIATNGNNIINGNNAIVFSIKKWKIEIDENNNIVITKK